MTTFRFQPSARLQRFLGKELIADPNLAIIEFVKNAYDAGATKVFINFRITEFPSRLSIEDNGAGMDLASFERNWMHPGYSEKAPDAPPGHRISAITTGGRVPVGEKGLGRLAAGRLGNRLEVFTRRRASDRWLHVDFQWDRFDDMTKRMDEVQIPYDYESIPDDPSVHTGTIVVISGLQQIWDGKVRGRPAAGRSRTKLGRLKQDLRLLMRPFAANAREFVIYIDSDSFLDESDIGIVSAESVAEDADYIYGFEFKRKSRGNVTISRQLQRSERIIEELGGPKRERLPTVRLNDVAHLESRPDSLDCGPFRGQFIYTPPPAARRAREIDAAGHGVLLYRDGVLVEPYGLDGDDWVGVSSRKAQRQGYALVQPATFSGYVSISREANTELRDMSNRQGLIENDASEVFVQHVRAEFLFFESIIFDELSRRWTTPEERAARESVESLDLAAVRLRAVAHSLGQPLMGLGVDLAGIRLVAERLGIPPGAREDLSALADSAERHLTQARSVLRRFRDVPPAERSEVALDTLVHRAVEEVEPLASSLGVSINLVEIPSRKVFVHEELLIEALKELIRNAVEVPRDNVVGEVNVYYRDVMGDPAVEIRDNGTGIAGARLDDELGIVESTKGRPGEGLPTVEAIVLASRGQLRLVDTGPGGTHVQVRLPERLSGLRTYG